MRTPPLYVYLVRVNDQLREALSIAPPEWVEAHGLPHKSIVGIYTQPAPKGGKPPLESFWTNPDFLDLLHSVVAEHGPRLPALLATALEQWEGIVYLVDERSAPTEDGAAATDVIGGFEVNGGQLNAASYLRNPNYDPVTASGALRLDALLATALTERALVAGDVRTGESEPDPDEPWELREDAEPRS
jgi:hypothetical protein